jgi:hypothetical protein
VHIIILIRNVVAARVKTITFLNVLAGVPSSKHDTGCSFGSVILWNQ